MYTGLIAKRYATALADFAAANGEERRTFDEVQRLVDAYDGDPSVRAALFSPVLPVEAKLGVVRQLFDGGIGRTLDRFVGLVIRHRRERYLCFMLHSFMELSKRRHGIVDATLTTAAPVDDAVAAHVSEIARRQTDCREVRIHRRIDESLIGGFVFRMDDLLVDASLSTQLERLRRSLGEKSNRIV